MRSPRFSKRSLIAPVKSRRAASGLMIDKVRSTVIRNSRSGRSWAVISGASVRNNGWRSSHHSGLSLPARRRLLPVGQLMPGLARAAPAVPRSLDRGRVVTVEEIGTAGKRLEVTGFEAVDKDEH